MLGELDAPAGLGVASADLTSLVGSAAAWADLDSSADPVSLVASQAGSRVGTFAPIAVTFHGTGSMFDGTSGCFTAISGSALLPRSPVIGRTLPVI
jgi:hypothetical protein